MSNYQFRRLWDGAATVLATNLLQNGSVDPKFNAVLTRAAVAAFDGFANTTASASISPAREEGAPSGRRRRRSRTPQPKSTDHPSPRAGDHTHASSALPITPNDNFFEFQRTRGYRLASPCIADCESVRQLEEEHISRAVARYLRHCPANEMAASIAHRLETCGTGVSIDLWAAVQRGSGAYHAYHVHEQTIISGVYYSSCPRGCAPLVLKSPPGKGEAEDANEQACHPDSNRESISEKDVVIHPKEGLLLLFPPWLSHGVPLVKEVEAKPELISNNLPRVSWAFNLTGRLAAIGDPWSVTLPSVPLHS